MPVFSVTPDESLVLQKLTKMLGVDRAQELYVEVLEQLGLSGLRSPDDRLKFGQILTRRPSGLEYALGRAINIQAILQGAEQP